LSYVVYVDFSGWLSRKQLSNSDAVFATFESIWPDLYRYVVQSLNPKMDVCLLLLL